MTAPFALRPANWQEAAGREWLVANGLGGYASATAAGSNSRAYHGLLVAAARPPADRKLLFSSLDEEIEGISLANHQYPGVIHPQGYKYLKQFSLDPLPRFSYQAGDMAIEKTIFMIQGENTAIIAYRIKNGQGRMRLTPLVHSRSFHAAAPLPQLRQAASPSGTVIHSDIILSLQSDGLTYVPQETVYYNFEYEQERQRGLSWKEDLLAPGCFEIDLSGDMAFAISASTWRTAMPDWKSAQKKETARVDGLAAPLPLAMAADAFLVRRGSGHSLIAGYHWFDDWGRDAMISLPGLLVATGRLDLARSVLLTFASAMKDGVLPNDLGAGSYNTVDASLWFVQAAAGYYRQSHDHQTLRRLLPRILEVVERYRRPGEGFGMDGDGLIQSGPALTWMDARVDGRPVTARSGKCCEINALWYSALKDVESLSSAAGQRRAGRRAAELAERVRESYGRFWNSETGCLYDVIDPQDASIRPNQVIALKLPDLLSQVKRESILEVVERELLTPYGLRTLSPRDPRYIGRYEGGPAQRDSAYHQGTVWPWLIGPYVDGLLAVRDRSEATRSQAREALMPLLTLNTGGINTLPEVFDGDSPHRPGGCISQAWSVGEALRAAAATSG
ncbi:MAG TPA: amylo-alpha-1,6-glucosidase [Methanothrix sp.]|nr:amylo-alpha-1,6-glucosidase [Methanothrix sp.]HPT19254.1 amylo-alpha-1,6-glucosidase [Methanothrix sp.]